MPEKNVPFVYSIDETVEWAAKHIGGMRTTRDPENVALHIEAMRERGWDNQKILEKCSVTITRPSAPQIPLHDIVQVNHPILQEWELNEIRSGLYKAAINEIAEFKTRLFDLKTIPHKITYIVGEPDPRTLEWMEKRITFLEIYAYRLTQEYSKPQGIRNR